MFDAIEDVSIAALSSWLKSQGLPHSANSREQIRDRLKKLIENGRLSREQFLRALIAIEEASGKRIYIHAIADPDLEAIRNDDVMKRRLQTQSYPITEEEKPAPRYPARPTLVYAQLTDRELRVKWAETHVKIDYDVVKEKTIRKKVTKVIVLLVDRLSGWIQLRLDKPEDLYPHPDEKGRPSTARYVAHYHGLMARLLPVATQPVELRTTLRTLVEREPRVVRLPLNDFRTEANSRVRFASNTDIRDDEDWKAMHEEGGDVWVHDSEAVYWLPGTSEGKISREVFTELDARVSRLRVEADCHEDEIQYAISQIKQHHRPLS